MPGLTAVIRLRPAVLAGAGTPGEARLVGRPGGQSIGGLTEAQQQAARALMTGEHAEDALLSAAAAGGGGRLAEVYGLVAALRAGNWLVATLRAGGRPVLSVYPLGGRPAGAAVPSAADVLRYGMAADGEAPAGPLVLSRFAVGRRDGEALVLESPLSAFGVQVIDPLVLGSVHAAARPRPLDELVTLAPLAAGAAATALRVLAACRLLVPAGAEEADPELAQWSAHELWFHARSRQGRHDLPWGATNWAKQRGVALLPARRGRPARRAGLPLHAPELAEVSRRDPSLTEALEQRRSIRAHDDRTPITAGQLGEFLYRAARTRSTWVADGAELISRPYPSGGALHELELYPLISMVDGIPPGLYHYDSAGHRLDLVAEAGPLATQLTDRAAVAARMTGTPQVLIVVTARFGRTMRKYSSMAYALTLKNLGGLYLAMYLVATAMGLAPCALGGGDSDLFAQLTGLDYVTESSVGEFLLGSAPGAARRAREETR